MNCGDGAPCDLLKLSALRHKGGHAGPPCTVNSQGNSRLVRKPGDCRHLSLIIFGFFLVADEAVAVGDLTVLDHALGAACDE